MSILEHFDNQTDKYGYSDGNAVPVEAEAARDLIIDLINKATHCVAEKFDRMGAHNWCLINIDYSGGTKDEIIDVLVTADENCLFDRCFEVVVNTIGDVDDIVEQFILNGLD